MNTAELIRAACSNPRQHPEVTLYWDRQDTYNPGPAYRTADESGALDCIDWKGEAGGCELEYFFKGPDGAYLGPDENGAYPVLIPA